MTYLPMHFDKVQNQLVATINDHTELKVAWLKLDHKIIVLKKETILKTIKAPNPLPADFFIDYCFSVANDQL